MIQNGLDLNVRPKTIKSLEENMFHHLTDAVLNDVLMHLTLNARTTKEKIHKWHCIKLKCFCTATKSPKKNKRKYNLLNGRRYFQIVYLRRG